MVLSFLELFRVARFTSAGKWTRKHQGDEVVSHVSAVRRTRQEFHP
jgi:hypothetical protein